MNGQCRETGWPATRLGWAMLAAVILLGIALRLPDFQAPPADFLSWRTTQTLMVARNFHEGGMNLFRPEVDWRTLDEAAPRGTVGGTELHVVPYLTAMLYRVVGPSHAAGRVFPLLFALVGAVLFFRLARWCLGNDAAAAAAALLLTLSPYFLYTGRVQMPESFVYAMTFGTLLYYARWLCERTTYTWALSLVFCCFMLLGKIQLGMTAVPMGVMTFVHFGRRAFRVPALYAYAAAAAGATGAWLAWSHGVLLAEAGISFAQPGLLGWRRFLLDPAYYREIGLAVWKWAVTPAVLLLALPGLLLIRGNARRALALGWLAGALLFFLVMPGGNRANGYYHMMLAPPAILLAARSLSLLMGKGRLGMALAAALLLFACGYGLHIARILWEPRHIDAYHCGAWLRENTPEDVLVATSSPNPATLYFADRVGWMAWAARYGEGVSFDVDYVNRTRALGARVLAIPGDGFDDAYSFGQHALRDTLYDTFRCIKKTGFTVFVLAQPADLNLGAGQVVSFNAPMDRRYLRGTWGPVQYGGEGAFVAMGPSDKSALHFQAGPGPWELRLTWSSAVPGQSISVRVNGAEAGVYAPPPLPGREIRSFSIPRADGHRSVVVFFEAARQNEHQASMVLHEFYLLPAPE